ncbi:hypothetical protein DFJ74DRAFT_715328, partial [Hyaloraphidium curvatum]
CPATPPKTSPFHHGCTGLHPFRNVASGSGRALPSAGRAGPRHGRAGGAGAGGPDITAGQLLEASERVAGIAADMVADVMRLVGGPGSGGPGERDEAARAALDIFRATRPALRRLLSEFVGATSIERRRRWGAVDAAAGEPWCADAEPSEEALSDTRAYNSNFKPAAQWACSIMGGLAKISRPVRRRLSEAPQFMDDLALCLLSNQVEWDFFHTLQLHRNRFDASFNQDELGDILMSLAAASMSGTRKR